MSWLAIPGPPELETRRLRLRQWQTTDLPLFAALNADPEVTRYLPAALSRNESDAMAQRCATLIEQHGWGFWAVELKQQQEFIGLIGLNRPGVALPFSPCVEVGWRLAHRYWGQGLATEGARACLDFGFAELGLMEIVAFTAQGNLRSQAVMQRLGMVCDPQTFDHPALPAGHPLRRHVLYRARRT